MYSAVIPAPWGGRLGIRDDGAVLTGLDFLPAPTAVQPPRGELAIQVCHELEHYFSDPSATFSVPQRRGGTPFQQRVWAALVAIPAGRVLRYGELAAQLGASARAVGQACGSNPLPLLVPCHRVLAARGLGGFDHRQDGERLDIKLWLLGHEGYLLPLVP